MSVEEQEQDCNREDENTLDVEDMVPSNKECYESIDKLKNYKAAGLDNVVGKKRSRRIEQDNVPLNKTNGAK